MLWIVRQSDQGNWLFYLHLMYLNGTASAGMSPAFACVPYNIYQIQTQPSSIILNQNNHRLFWILDKYCQVFHPNEKQYEKVIFKNMQPRRQLFKAVVYLVDAGVPSWKFAHQHQQCSKSQNLKANSSRCKTIKLILQTLFVFWRNENLSFFFCAQGSIASSLFEFFITTSFC